MRIQQLVRMCKTRQDETNTVNFETGLLQLGLVYGSCEELKIAHGGKFARVIYRAQSKFF